MEGYMQERERAELERLRAEFAQAEKMIATGPTPQGRRNQRHEDKFPGRTAALLCAADLYVQEAEYVLPALAERNPAQKMALIAFRNSVRLAHQFILRAVTDREHMLGSATSRVRSKGAVILNAKGNGVTPVIKLLAQRRDALGDYLQSCELWPELYDKLDVLQLHPREVGTGKGKRYTHDGGETKYENFRKTIRRYRDTA